MLTISSPLGNLQDDHAPEFALQFYRALSVVCDDLFFARYRHESSPARSLAESSGVNVTEAATGLFKAIFGNTYNEDEKAHVVDDLLDTRLLPATDGAGVTFNKERIMERCVFR